VNPRKLILWAAVIFLAAFTVFVFDSDQREFTRAQTDITNHARVIANALWHCNRRGALEYLTLACQRDAYKELVVRDREGQTFIQLSGPPARGIQKLFLTLGLVHELPLAAVIHYDNRPIGEIRATFYCQAIYLQIYVLFALILLYLVLYLYANLLGAKQELELRVRARTRELDRLNRSLRHEIEQHKQAEKERRRSEERFQKLAELLPIPVWEADLDKNFTYLNRAGYETFDLTPEELTRGVSILSLLLPEERERGNSNYRRIAGGEHSNGNEYWCQARDGRRFPVLIYSTAIIEEGRPVGVRGITLDISERLEAEQKLRENEEKLARFQKMESLGLLAGGVAHDLNNILSGIVTYPELLLLDLEENSKFRKPLETIKKSGEQAAAIVQDLLTMTRGIATSKEPLQLNRLIGDYLASPELRNLAARHPGISLATALDDELLPIQGSAVHLRKAIMNLVANAFEAVVHRGRVTIATASTYLETPLDGYEEIAPGEYSVLTISDTGKGIPGESLTRIFEPFYTRKVMGYSGTGLGLAIVWNVAKDHNASLDVSSSPRGTTFKLYFPVTRELPASGGDKCSPLEEFRGGGKTILIVDDNESQRVIARDLLERLGYQAETATSGEEAIEILRQKDFDLLLLDMIMEPGINGRQTYEEIIRFRPGQKAVIVSGYAQNEEVLLAQQAGVGAFVKKPVTLKTLGRALRKVLREGK